MGQPEYVPGQNNPGQERPKVEGLSKEELFTALARRVSFPTEEESRAVLAAISDHYGEHSPADTEGDEEEEGDDPAPEEVTAPAAPRARKAAARPRK